MRRPNRRTFLRAAGVSLALPWLESTVARGAPAAAAAPPRRMLAVCTGLGLHAPNLVPKEAGRGYTPTPYLDVLKDVRDRVTVVSGLSHPQVDGGHSAEDCFLTAAPHPGAPSFKNTISLDQFAVERLPAATRFPSLVLGGSGTSLSVSRGGVAIPAESRPSQLFARLFVTGSASQVAAQTQRLEDGRSVMDTVLGPAKRLQAKVGPADRERLDQYFTAVREFEGRLASSQAWARTPKPKVAYALPRDNPDPPDTFAKLRLMLDLVRLAFQTDSTRVVTVRLTGTQIVDPIEGVTMDAHNLSHHSQDPDKLAQLRRVEAKQVGTVARFLSELRQVTEGGETLLDRTAVVYGSSLGNASTHNTRNLPIILAGGGFKHGQHLAFDAENNAPLCRLFVSVLQRLGVEADQFGSGKGTLPGLELA